MPEITPASNLLDALLTRIRCSWVWKKAGDLKRIVRLRWTTLKEGDSNFLALNFQINSKALHLNY
jgi:hypothetical protein